MLLKYRVPGNGLQPQSGPYPKSPMALEDTQRTVGLVRRSPLRRPSFSCPHPGRPHLILWHDVELAPGTFRPDREFKAELPNPASHLRSTAASFLRGLHA